MKKVPVLMMTTWMWLGLVAVVRLSTAEEPRRDAAEALADLEALWSDSEPPKEPRSGEEFLPVPVWRFVEVPDAADSLDLGRPQFGCSNTSLSVRLSLIRHSGLRLQDGRRWLSVEEGCHGSVRSLGSWQLLKIPYTSCHVELLMVNGSHYHQLKVRYLDHLLQANVTAVVSCEDPAGSLYPAAPLVRCRATDVTVKLPLKSSLTRVRALGKGDVVGSVLTTSTPDAVLVQISTTADKDSFLEVIYLDSVGKMFSMLAACLKAEVDTERTRQRRDLLKLHIKDLWEYGHHPAHQYELNHQQDFLYPGAHCKGPKCKYMTPSPLPDCDDVTPSPLPDCDDVTPSPLPDCDDVTPSPLPDCDDVTPSPLPDCDDVTPSPLPDCDDVTPSPLPDCDDVTPSQLPDCDDVTPSPLPICDKPTNVTICVYISVITRLVKVGGSFTSLVSVRTFTSFSDRQLADVGSGSTLGVTGSSQAFTGCVGDEECSGVVGVIHNMVRVGATIPGSVISDAVGNSFSVSGFIRFGFIPTESGSVPVVFVCTGVSGVMDGLSDIGGSDGSCFQTIIAGDDGLLNSLNEPLPNLCFRQSFFGTNGPQFETHIGSLDNSGACSNLSNGCFGLDSVFSGFIESSCGVPDLLDEDGSFNLSLSNDTCCLNLNASCCSDQNISDKTSCSCSCGLEENCCNLSFPDSSSDINCCKTNLDFDTFCNISHAFCNTHVPFCGGINDLCGFGCNTSLTDCLAKTCCNSTSSLDFNATCFGLSENCYTAKSSCFNGSLPDSSFNDSFCACDLNNFSGVPISCAGCSENLTGCPSNPCCNNSGSNTACCDFQNSSGQGVSNGFVGSSCFNVNLAGSSSDGTFNDGSTVAFVGFAFVGTRSCDDVTTTTPNPMTTTTPLLNTTTTVTSTTSTTITLSNTTTPPLPTTTSTTSTTITLSNTTTPPPPTTTTLSNTTTPPLPTTSTTISTTPPPTNATTPPTTTTTPPPLTNATTVSTTTTPLMTTTPPLPTTTSTTTSTTPPPPTTTLTTNTTTTLTSTPLTTTTTTPPPPTTSTTPPRTTTTSTITSTTSPPTTTTSTITSTTSPPTTTTSATTSTTPPPTTTTSATTSTTPPPTTTTSATTSTTPPPTTTTSATTSTTPPTTTTSTTTSTTPPPTTTTSQTMTQAPTDDFVTICFIFRIITRLVNVGGFITSLCSVATITSFSADGGVADNLFDVNGFNQAITVPFPSCTGNGDSSDVSVIQSLVSVKATVPSNAVTDGVTDNSFVRFGCLQTEVGSVPALLVCAGVGSAINGSGLGLSSSCFPVILTAGDCSSNGSNADSSCSGFHQSFSGTNRTLFNVTFSTLYNSSTCNISPCFGGGGVISGINGSCLNNTNGNCSSQTVCLSLNGSCCGGQNNTDEASCGCFGLRDCNGSSSDCGSNNTYCSNGTSYLGMNSLSSVIGNVSVFNCSCCNSSMGIFGIDGCSGVSNGTFAVGGPCCNGSQMEVDCSFNDMFNSFGLNSQCCSSSNCSELDCCCSSILGSNFGSGCPCSNTSLIDCNSMSISNHTCQTVSCNASSTNCTSNDTCCGSFGVGGACNMNLTNCSNGTFCNSSASNSSCVTNGLEPCCSASLTNCTSNHTAGNNSACGSSLSGLGGACCGFSNDDDGGCSWWDLLSCCFLRSAFREGSTCSSHSSNDTFTDHHHHHVKQQSKGHHVKQQSKGHHVKQQTKG